MLIALKELYLIDTRVSDLRPLSLCSSLKILNLDYTQVSNLRPLSSCPALKILNLCNTSVSEENINSFKAINPNIIIIH